MRNPIKAMFKRLKYKSHMKSTIAKLSKKKVFYL